MRSTLARTEGEAAMKPIHRFRGSALAPGCFGVFPVLVFALLSLTPHALFAQSLKRVPFPYSPIGINCLPWFIAKDARIAEKYGIGLDPVFIGASSALFNAM